MPRKVSGRGSGTFRSTFQKDLSLAVMRESDGGAKGEAEALSGRLHRWDWVGWQLAGERTERIWAVDLGLDVWVGRGRG